MCSLVLRSETHLGQKMPGTVQREFKLSDQAVKDFQRDGFVVIPAENIFQASEVESIAAWTKEIEKWPETPGKWMMYFEKSSKDGSRIVQRIEKFLDYHEQMNQLFGRHSRFERMCGQLFEEEAILFKEKINYKLPGGEGFKPHQDYAAGWWLYGQSLQISVLVCVDPATRENGCLEVVAGEHRKGLFGEQRKEIPEEYVQEFKWLPVETKPGDVVFFDSFVPHRSEPNNSSKPRRILYLSYAKAAEGDFRQQYYSEKRKNLPPDCEREEGKTYQYKI